MNKFINLITLGIPYLINVIRIAMKIRKQLDLNGDGKITNSELLKLLKSGEVNITLKED